jgi:hypothetical protein
MSELSEVQPIKDIAVVGLQPSALQSFVIYGAAIPAYNDRPEPAVANKKDFWRAAGFKLIPVIELISDHLAGRLRRALAAHALHSRPAHSTAARRAKARTRSPGVG